jgi:hypothetical protein
MFDPTSLKSLEELQQLLNTLNERLTFLEKVVIPSRVTKEELHSGISGAKIFTMSSVASLRNDLKAVRDATATKADIQQLKEEVSKSRSERS